MLKILKNFTWKEWCIGALAVLFIVVQVWLDLTMPDYMSEITMLIQTEGSTMSQIITAGAKMMACAFGSLAASILTAVCAGAL